MRVLNDSFAAVVWRFARIDTRFRATGGPEGRCPVQYAAATTYYLMQLNGEWVIAAEDRW